MKIEIEESAFNDVVNTIITLANRAEKSGNRMATEGNEKGANFSFGRMVAYRRAARMLNGLRN